jgi:hypothetical protein
MKLFFCSLLVLCVSASAIFQRSRGTIRSAAWFEDAKLEYTILYLISEHSLTDSSDRLSKGDVAGYAYLLRKVRISSKAQVIVRREYAHESAKISEAEWAQFYGSLPRFLPENPHIYDVRVRPEVILKLQESK